MDTPHDCLLTRDMPKSLILHLDKAASVLESCINYGTHIFSGLMEKGVNEYYETIPPLFYRHILEMADATQVLLHQGVADPSDVLLRSAFEAFLGLEFVITKDTEKRCKSYIVADTVSELKIYRSDDYKETMGNDSNLDNLIKEKQAGLESQRYQLVYNEYLRAKKANRNRPPNWYSLFEGPKNLASLSKELDRYEWYSTLYPSFSQVSHASNILRKIWSDPTTGHLEIRSLRSIQKLNSNIALTIGFIIESSSMILENYLPNLKPDFKQWYLKEIYAFRQKLYKDPNYDFRW
ncbi:hypothetical protein JJB07_05285 [Tumebacillus sp. ITR2]|uniref:Uncharacterized protein n=1 Tax=Tumebacillus amylolyticus TaxID=2801339 RepID=A0ABS1J710_9BACL|nr:DUF5677 domain-containing protein [Tumebacillus amylolyticus]MBL0386061.1 hypothetical protein [Tumebacillus amylolyticus]